MEDRVKKLRRYLKEHDLDAVLLSSPANIVYCSGFSGFSSPERDGYILITLSAAYILTGPLYRDAVNDIPHLKLVSYSGNHPLAEQLSQLAAKHRLQRIGFEAENLTVAEWKYLSKSLSKLIPIDLRHVRIKKLSDEMGSIMKATLIADKALYYAMKLIKPGMTETELAKILEDILRSRSSDIAFPTIVAFGQNAAIPHHKSNGTKLKKNDLILIDFGAVSNEYRSDMTRTFFIGKATEEQRKAYQAVLESQKKGEAYIAEVISSPLPRGERARVRVKASAVDKVARDYLTSLGYPSIPHSLGHGIGLAVHEAPALSPNSKDLLEERMVFSIEPGVYFPGKFGIRIEDLYTILDGKLLRLTHSPSTLLIL